MTPRSPSKLGINAAIVSEIPIVQLFWHLAFGISIKSAFLWVFWGFLQFLEFLYFGKFYCLRQCTSKRC